MPVSLEGSAREHGQASSRAQARELRESLGPPSVEQGLHPTDRLEAQIALTSLLSRAPQLRAAEEHLVWRDQPALRGMTRFRVATRSLREAA